MKLLESAWFGKHFLSGLHLYQQGEINEESLDHFILPDGIRPAPICLPPGFR
jgi:hypothetical protein